MAQKNIETVNVNNKLEVINNKETELNKNSIRYTSNVEALAIVENYEQLFKESWKEYDIKLGVDKSKNPPLYYIIFWENALDIWLQVWQLEEYLDKILKSLSRSYLPQFLEKNLSKFITELKIQEDMSENNTNKKSLKRFYNKKTSQTETNIEKEARKLEIKEIASDGAKYSVLRYWENIIFGLQQIMGEDDLFVPYAIWNSVEFKINEILQITKDVIEWKRSIESIKKEEIIKEISHQSNFEVPIAEQEKDELNRFKEFLNACIKLKEYQSYPISFGLKEYQSYPISFGLKE